MLTAELARINETLKRLYRTIEDGIVDLDDDSDLVVVDFDL